MSKKSNMFFVNINLVFTNLSEEVAAINRFFQEFQSELVKSILFSILGFNYRFNIVLEGIDNE